MPSFPLILQNIYEVSYSEISWVAGTMIARLSFVRVITCSILSQFLPLLMHVVKQLAVMLTVKRLPGVAPDVGFRECTLHLPLQKQIKQNQLWLWNPEDTSPEIQNRGTSGPEIGHVCGSTKRKKVTPKLSFPDKSSSKKFRERQETPCLAQVSPSLYFPPDQGRANWSGALERGTSCHLSLLVPCSVSHSIVLLHPVLSLAPLSSRAY